jgi:hypothetical protein
MLGLGTVLAFLIAVNETSTLRLKCLMFGSMLLFATQKRPHFFANRNIPGGWSNCPRRLLPLA